MADLKTHLADFVAPEADALVFTSPTGTPLRHNNFRRRVWLPALAEAGLNELHFHDLRHTGKRPHGGHRHYPAGDDGPDGRQQPTRRVDLAGW
jgi:integrase